MGPSKELHLKMFSWRPAPSVLPQQGRPPKQVGACPLPAPKTTQLWAWEGGRKHHFTAAESRPLAMEGKQFKDRSQNQIEGLEEECWPCANAKSRVTDVPSPAEAATKGSRSQTQAQAQAQTSLPPHTSVSLAWYCSLQRGSPGSRHLDRFPGPLSPSP